MIAVRFSKSKKLDAVLDLKQTFKSIAVKPFGGIESDADWRQPQDYENFESCYSQVIF